MGVLELLATTHGDFRSRANTMFNETYSEADLQRYARHQKGSFTLYNRGIKSGAAVSKSAAVTRQLDMAAGYAFGHGRVWEAPAQSVIAPENTTAAAAACDVFLSRSTGVLVLGITALDVAADADDIVIDTISIPAGSDAATDQYLASCTLTETARREAAWPAVQTSPAYEDITFPRVQTGTDYEIDMEVISQDGGEEPVFVIDAADRLVNNCRAYLSGSADTVLTRWVTHLM